MNQQAVVNEQQLGTMREWITLERTMHLVRKESWEKEKQRIMEQAEFDMQWQIRSQQEEDEDQKRQREVENEDWKRQQEVEDEDRKRQQEVEDEDRRRQREVEDEDRKRQREIEDEERKLRKDREEEDKEMQKAKRAKMCKEQEEELRRKDRIKHPFVWQIVDTAHKQSLFNENAIRAAVCMMVSDEDAKRLRTAPSMMSNGDRRMIK